MKTMRVYRIAGDTSMPTSVLLPNIPIKTEINLALKAVTGFKQQQKSFKWFHKSKYYKDITDEQIAFSMLALLRVAYKKGLIKVTPCK